MSTLAEQVVEQLKTDMDNVYDAGYQKGLKEIGGVDVSKFGIQNEVTGTGVVTLDYVNENEHNVEVKLSSDTVTDFSGIELECIGKNWFDLASAELQKGNSIKDDTGEVYWYGTGTAIVNFTKILPNTNYVLYAKQISYPYGKVTIWFYDSEKKYIGEKVSIGNTTLIPYEAVAFTTPENAHYCRMWYSSNDINTLQIELGFQVSHYELYVQPKTYTANADGTLTIPSFLPTMNIICNGIDISAKYYQCPTVEYDRFWDEYQQYGARTDYIDAFSQSFFTPKIFKPKYTIQPIKANSMFENNKSLNIDLREYGDFDFSKCTDGSRMFLGSVIKAIGCIDCIHKNSIYQAFTSAEELETIEKLIFYDGINYGMSDAFKGMYALKNLNFVGTIGVSVNLQWSPLLSDESVRSIIDCLKDLTGQTVQTLTLHADVKAKLTEEQIATITSKNWTLA